MFTSEFGSLTGKYNSTSPLATIISPISNNSKVNSAGCQKHYTVPNCYKGGNNKCQMEFIKFAGETDADGIFFFGDVMYFIVLSMVINTVLLIVCYCVRVD